MVEVLKEKLITAMRHGEKNRAKELESRLSDGAKYYYSQLSFLTIMTVLQEKRAKYRTIIMPVSKNILRKVGKRTGTS